MTLFLSSFFFKYIFLFYNEYQDHTYLSLFFDNAYSLVYKWGKVGRSAELDVRCDLVIDVKHLQETLTLTLVTSNKNKTMCVMSLGKK